MKNRAGITVIELIVVLSILLLIFALAFPALLRARLRGIELSSVSKMRQLYLSIEIYRDQFEGAPDDWSSGFAMGLPSYNYYFSEYILKKSEEIKSPFGEDITILNTGIEGAPGCISYIGYGYSPPFSDVIGSPFYGFLQKFQENSVLICDQYVNAKGTNMSIPQSRKRALSILISGQLISQFRFGNGSRPHFFSGEIK